MLRIQVIAIGKVKEAWMRQGIAEYQKRLGAYCRLELIELEEYRLPDRPSPAEIDRGLEEEGRRILGKGSGLLCPLCIEGEMLTSPSWRSFWPKPPGKPAVSALSSAAATGFPRRSRRPPPEKSAFPA